MRTLLTLLLCTLPPYSGGSEYSPDFAKLGILFSDAAYCGDAEHGGTKAITDFQCEPCKELLIATNASTTVVNVTVIENVSEQTLAFVGLLQLEPPRLVPDSALRIVVGFRGSVLPKNFADDHDDALVNPTAGGRGNSSRATLPGLVHRGLYRSYASLRQGVLREVSSRL